MVRWLVRAAAILVIVVAALVVLDFAELLVPVVPDETASMATTISGCKGRVLAQGLTYKISDPGQDDVVAVHAAETDEGKIIPDKDADDRTLVLRVAAGLTQTELTLVLRYLSREVRRHHDQAVPGSEGAQRAVLPAR